MTLPQTPQFDLYMNIKVNSVNNCSLTLQNLDILSVSQGVVCMAGSGADQVYSVRDIVDIAVISRRKLKMNIAFKPNDEPGKPIITGELPRLYSRKGLRVLKLKFGSKQDYNSLIHNFFLAKIFFIDVLTSRMISSVIQSKKFHKCKELPIVLRGKDFEETLKLWRDQKY